jgi:hypothetical protein
MVRTQILEATKSLYFVAHKITLAKNRKQKTKFSFFPQHKAGYFDFLCVNRSMKRMKRRRGSSKKSTGISRLSNRVAEI